MAQLSLERFLKIGCPILTLMIPTRHVHRHGLRYDENLRWGEDLCFYFHSLIPYSLTLRLIDKAMYAYSRTLGSLTPNRSDRQ